MKNKPIRIRSMNDLRFAKERYRNEVLLGEQAIGNSFRHLRSSFNTSLKNSMNRFGQLLAAEAVRRLFVRRRGDD